MQIVNTLVHYAYPTKSSLLFAFYYGKEQQLLSKYIYSLRVALTALVKKGSNLKKIILQIMIVMTISCLRRGDYLMWVFFSVNTFDQLIKQQVRFFLKKIGGPEKGRCLCRHCTIHLFIGL